MFIVASIICSMLFFLIYFRVRSLFGFAVLCVLSSLQSSQSVLLYLCYVLNVMSLLSFLVSWVGL